MDVKIPGAEQADQSGDDQVNRDDVIQQARYDEYQDACDEGDDRGEAECHVQGRSPFGCSRNLNQIDSTRLFDIEHCRQQYWGC